MSKLKTILMIALLLLIFCLGAFFMCLTDYVAARHYYILKDAGNDSGVIYKRSKDIQIYELYGEY